ncbi:MAG: protein kinase [Myxococcales bacterium]|nr:protein kinase [Myxococcales bacterium]MCB9542640.1 protein kinase [Myxococcales bacterium]
MHPCPKCGHQIEGRPNFCPTCGASQTYDRAGGDDPLIGRLIDNTYLVESLIGQGAMGRVYQAQHTTLRKKVALKILRSSLVGDPTVVKRFEREALAASRLNHPNCITIYGFGSEDGGDLLWMAMEFVQGRDLGLIIAEESPLETRRVVHIMTQVCEALDEAHSANIVHRDLKPANIVCFEHRRISDFVKVLDFGIAKIIDPEENYQPLTRDGIVCGTPAYMSPEQVQGFELDNRSDLFSLGIILYQTVTGQLPFFAESAVEVATKIVIDEPTPPSKARRDWSYPPELEAIVLKLLAKKKSDRFANAIEVKEALEECVRRLEERRDPSLELRPDEVAELLYDHDPRLEGASTVRLDDAELRRAQAAMQAGGMGAATVASPTITASQAATVASPVAPAPVPTPVAARPAARPQPQYAAELMRTPTNARRTEAAGSSRAVAIVAIVIAAAAAAGVGVWLFA